LGLEHGLDLFGGLPLDDPSDELRCGVAVVDCQSGQVVTTLFFKSGVEEIFEACTTRTIFAPLLSTLSSKASRPGQLSKSFVPLTPVDGGRKRHRVALHIARRRPHPTPRKFGRRR
jgi:hypothetical protein